MSENTQQTPSPSNVKTYAGSCHCGAVRFEAELDLTGPMNRCNCTICTKMGGAGLTIKPSAFRLVSGEEHLGRYAVGDSPNYRSFCKRCGVQCYGAGDVPQLGGAFASVNINTLDGIDPSKLTYQYWDGRHDNWMAGARSTPWPV
ncbi:GFA family protein [Pyxidicoccus fallax]|uniref:GFA family protein n=1 Tax=Pyxidicoccus fallax TaxID=394095 RepID=A0A848LAW5_9BACT|nr:GFA family protein [Pyxidicoccus fallax]NMO15767.1 GFA family protein [Pyxidicoccus fallax]NPC77305.1 GFA family protein [Pyxidicoccus fallax]